MKKQFVISLLIAAAILGACTTEKSDNKGGRDPVKNEQAAESWPDKTYQVVLDEALGGTVSVEPEIPADGILPAGTRLTVNAVPDEGYVVDSCYKKIWIMEQFNYGYYMEEMEDSATFILDPADQRFQTRGPSDKYHIGASFIKKDLLEGIRVTQNVAYAEVDGRPLVYDVYQPEKAESPLPAVVIIHGGGWSSNSEDIMRGMAREIASGGKYVAFSIDYRLLSDINRQGDPLGVSVVDIIEDVFGAMLHIRENAGEYNADPGNIAVTGDSAGGHLAAVVATMADKIGDKGFNGRSFEFKPTYIPEGKSLKRLRQGLIASVKAVAPSYGVFSLKSEAVRDMDGLLPPGAEASWLAGISPQDNIPAASERSLPPQHCQIGTSDPLIKQADVKAYVDALKQAGHSAEMVTVYGASHAYFDWKPDQQTRDTFNTIGREQLRIMLDFFDQVFDN